MGESSQLTLLSTLCKQPGPINWIPLLLSLAFPLSITSFALIKLVLTRSYANTASKNIKKKHFLYNEIYNVKTSFMWIWRNCKIENLLNSTEDRDVSRGFQFEGPEVVFDLPWILPVKGANRNTAAISQ